MDLIRRDRKLRGRECSKPLRHFLMSFSIGDASGGFCFGSRLILDTPWARKCFNCIRALSDLWNFIAKYIYVTLGFNHSRKLDKLVKAR